MNAKTKPKNASRVRAGWSWNKAVGIFYKAPTPKAGKTPVAVTLNVSFA